MLRMAYSVVQWQHVPLFFVERVPYFSRVTEQLSIAIDTVLNLSCALGVWTTSAHLVASWGHFCGVLSGGSGNCRLQIVHVYSRIGIGDRPRIHLHFTSDSK